jgi:hypothetical protein
MSDKDFDYVVSRGKEIAEKGSEKMLETVGVRGEVIRIRG